MKLTNFKALLTEDDAVSPVIGVILMVAITVILAAVIASFVLGLGDTATQTTPQASFSFEYEGGGANDLSVTHDGGDSIEAQELYIRGDFDSGSSSNGDWTTFGGTTNTGGSEITAGATANVDAGSEYDLRVVYETVEGDNSATLAQDSGPDA